VRALLEEFKISKALGAPGIAVSSDGSALEDGVPSDGTATMMNIEMNREAQAAAEKGSGKKKKGGAKAAATAVAAAKKMAPKKKK